MINIAVKVALKILTSVINAKCPNGFKVSDLKFGWYVNQYIKSLIKKVSIFFISIFYNEQKQTKFEKLQKLVKRH